MRRRRPLVWLLYASVTLLASATQASIFDTYGFGARGVAMANAHAAAAADYSAVYYNPAALTVHKSPHLGVGLNLIMPRLSVDRDRPPGVDDPATELPRTNAGVNLGLLFPLGGLIENRFALGIGAYLPSIQVTRVAATDGETPQFYRYGALTDKLVLAGAAAFEIHPTVSVGLGVQMLGSLDGSATVELDLLTQRFVRKNVEVDVHATLAVTAGVLVRPTPDLRLGFSFRDALDLRYDILTRVVIRDVGVLVADIRGTALYTPQQYTWAAAYDPFESLTVTGDLVWARWSAAPDPTAFIGVTLDGEPLGFGAIEAETAPVSLGAEDTLSPRVGVEWRADERWTLRAGYAFLPTPLPSQTGQSNHIDMDAHQVGTGFGVSFPDPLAMHEAPVTVELSAQVSILETRRMEKVDAEDRVGSYAAGGPIWHTALTVRHDFR